MRQLVERRAAEEAAGAGDPAVALVDRVAGALLLGANAALVAAGPVYVVALAGQAAFVLVAVARPGLPRYYALVTWATVVSLWNYLRRGVPATWEAAEGTR